MFYGTTDIRVFRAIVSTADGRIREGSIYSGNFFWISKSPIGATPGWRIKVVDELGQIMTFDPKIFGPAATPV